MGAAQRLDCQSGGAEERSSAVLEAQAKDAEPGLALATERSEAAARGAEGC